jgi:hypothetical protein
MQSGCAGDPCGCQPTSRKSSSASRSALILACSSRSSALTLLVSVSRPCAAARHRRSQKERGSARAAYTHHATLAAVSGHGTCSHVTHLLQRCVVLQVWQLQQLLLVRRVLADLLPVQMVGGVVCNTSKLRRSVALTQLRRPLPPETHTEAAGWLCACAVLSQQQQQHSTLTVSVAACPAWPCRAPQTAWSA